VDFTVQAHQAASFNPRELTQVATGDYNGAKFVVQSLNEPWQPF
jgi:hypothetical protein